MDKVKIPNVYLDFIQSRVYPILSYTLSIPPYVRSTNKHSKVVRTRMRHVLIDGVKIMFDLCFDLCLFIFRADWQASAVDSLKTHNSYVYDELYMM